jgi:hypothetical protein
MELDVYYKDLQLAFEYHGRQHYIDAFQQNDFTKQQLRDTEKYRACKERGITLIPIPFWWDETEKSLAATLHKHRPALQLTLSKDMNVVDGIVPVESAIPETPPAIQKKRKLMDKNPSTIFLPIIKGPEMLDFSKLYAMPSASMLFL